jgi:hypothetical protein|tara:strand:+ start:63 stop:437 length:375 start_codon:yes stop_codon:yes gene_type:complete
MSQGFSGREANAERSLEKSSKELRTLKKVIERFKDDPKGKKKMLKKMQKYWRSPIAEVKSLDYKPKGASWTPPEDLQQNLEKMAEYIDPRQEVSEDSNINNNALTVEQEEELRARLTKNDKADD